MYYVNFREDSRHHQRFVLVIKVNSEWGRGVIESSVKGRGHDTMVIVDINTYSGNLAYTQFYNLHCRCVRPTQGKYHSVGSQEGYNGEGDQDLDPRLTLIS